MKYIGIYDGSPNFSSACVSITNACLKENDTSIWSHDTCVAAATCQVLSQHRYVFYYVLPSIRGTCSGILPATLIEGADYASFTYAVADPVGTFTVGAECSIKVGSAVCVEAAEGTVATATKTVVVFGIEGGGTIGQTQLTGAPASGSSPANLGAASGSGTESNAPSSTQPSAGVRASASAFGTLAGLLLACYLV
ncbi:hypothetical protein C8R43DRAFT_1123905 [Mycena crocata]|nr:hypothetical protein C8R43DRAFT_1123905 [Mycena crocata]